MEVKLLSIIIPCFNSFNLMKACLNSLEKQINDKIEVIIIDDNSSDHSYKQLLEYKKHSKINMRVFRNETNMGPGPTRNRGIQNAYGKYLMFLDSDDYLQDICIEQLLSVLLNKDIDCVIYDYNLISSKGSKRRRTISTFNGKKLTKNEVLVYITGCPWCKVFLTKLIQENNVVFANLKRNEDMPFIKHAISVCNTFYYLNEYLYNYVMNENSLMHNRTLLDENNAKEAFSIVERNIYQELEREAIWIKEVLYATTNTLIRKRERRENIKEHISGIETAYPNWRVNSYIKGFPRHVRVCIWLIKRRLLFALYLLIYIDEKTKNKGKM